MEKVEIGQLYVWAGKTWRVEWIRDGRAHIVNVAKAENTATLPLTQFRPDMRHP